MELEEWSNSISDVFIGYWAEAIKELALYAALEALDTHLKDRFRPGSVSSMSPGSLQDWPISEQKPLFNLMGNTYDKIGVKLTESFIPAGFFDEFSFFLLDSGFQTLTTTTDPLGANAQFVVDIDGNPGGLPAAYDSSAPGHLAVPEGGSTLSLLLLALGAAGCRGLKRARSAEPLAT